MADLQAGGFGLAFVAYPAACTRLHAAANFFSVLFFFMLVLLAIDSSFALTETVVAALVESGVLESTGLFGYGGRVAGGRSAADHKTLITAAVCVVTWLLGFLGINRGGYYWVKVFDTLGVGFTLFAVTGMEAFAINYFIGVDAFLHGIRQTLGPEVAQAYDGTLKYMRFCWTIVCPLLCATLMIATLFLMLTAPHADLVCANGNETDKDCGKDGSWGIAIGIALCFIASLAIPFIGFRHWYAGTKAAADTTGRAAMPAVGTAGLRSSGIELMDTKDAALSLAVERGQAGGNGSTERLASD